MKFLIFSFILICNFISDRILYAGASEFYQFIAMNGDRYEYRDKVIPVFEIKDVSNFSFYYKFIYDESGDRYEKALKYSKRNELLGIYFFDKKSRLIEESTRWPDKSLINCKYNYEKVDTRKIISKTCFYSTGGFFYKEKRVYKNEMVDEFFYTEVGKDGLEVVNEHLIYRHDKKIIEKYDSNHNMTSVIKIKPIGEVVHPIIVHNCSVGMINEEPLGENYIKKIFNKGGRLIKIKKIKAIPRHKLPIRISNCGAKLKK